MTRRSLSRSSTLPKHGEAPLEINVIVSSGSNGYGGGNKYYINGSEVRTLRWKRARPIVFCRAIPPIKQCDFRCRPTVPTGGSEYTSNIDYVGSTGSSGAYLQFKVPADIDTETLYYYCQHHPGMGGRIFITAATGTGYEIVAMNCRFRLSPSTSQAAM